MRNAAPPYISENIAPGFPPQYFLITRRQRERKNAGRLGVVVWREGERDPVFLSFSIYVSQKIFFPMRVQSSAGDRERNEVTVIQQNTVASTGGFYFPRNYSRGVHSESFLPFSLRVSRGRPFSRYLCSLAHVCTELHSRVSAGESTG